MFISAVKEPVYVYWLLVHMRHEDHLCTYTGHVVASDLHYRNWLTPKTGKNLIEYHTGDVPIWYMPIGEKGSMLARTESGRLYAVVAHSRDKDESFYVTIDTSFMDDEHKKRAHKGP